MSKKALTDFAVKHWKPDPSRRVEVPDDGCAGLYLVVQPSGAKSWAFRYRFDGKPMKYTIGSYPTVSLGQAHGDAGKALESVRLGIDPAATKRRGPPPEGTVKALIATYR